MSIKENWRRHGSEVVIRWYQRFFLAASRLAIAAQFCRPQREKNSGTRVDLARLKGHSQLCDWADLDTGFSHFEKSFPQPEIKVHLEIRFIFRRVLFDFHSFTEKPVFECPFAHPMILF